MFPGVRQCETRFTLFAGSVRSLSSTRNVFGGIVAPGHGAPMRSSQRGGFPRPILNFSVLPDFAAIGGLIAVFWTLLPRTRQSRLNMWLVGWVLLLVHIVALFVAQNTSGNAKIGRAHV